MVNPLIVYGGKQIIDLVHVAGVVDVRLKAYDYDENITINAGSGKGIAILDLSKLIQEIGHGTSKLILRKKRRGEVERFVAKIDNAKKLLKWAPKTELKDGFIRLLYSGRKSELQ
jgi:nucleoside-diphosphate-sugar epimerase